MQTNSEHFLGGRRSIALLWERHSRGDVNASRALIRVMNPCVQGIAMSLSVVPEIYSAVLEAGYNEVTRGVMRLDVEPENGFMSHWGGSVCRAMLLEKSTTITKLKENNLLRVV